MDVRKIIKNKGKSEEQLIPILLEIQKQKEGNYISSNDIKIIEEETGIAEVKIYSVISFYSALSLKPRGKYIIQVCNNVPCQINNSEEINKALKKELGIGMGEATDDMLFSLEHTSCLGHCDIAPVIKINDKIYGNLNEQKVKDIVTAYREGRDISE